MGLETAKTRKNGSNATKVLTAPLGDSIRNKLANIPLEVRLDLITATAAISGLSSIMMGFLTNLPVALA